METLKRDVVLHINYVRVPYVQIFWEKLNCSRSRVGVGGKEFARLDHSVVHWIVAMSFAEGKHWISTTISCCPAYCLRQTKKNTANKSTALYRFLRLIKSAVLQRNQK